MAHLSLNTRHIRPVSRIVAETGECPSHATDEPQEAGLMQVEPRDGGALRAARHGVGKTWR
ncbi:protein of unknown function [Paraburkholderia kururiensis]